MCNANNQYGVANGVCIVGCRCGSGLLMTSNTTNDYSSTGVNGMSVGGRPAP